MADFTIKQHDLLPELQAVLSDRNGPVDLTNASAVEFHMRLPGSTGTAKVDAAATFVDKPNGVVKYTWTGTDTSVADQWYGEFEITWIGGKLETFPNDGQLLIGITGDLA